MTRDHGKPPLSLAAEARTNPRSAVPDAALVERMAREDQEALGELRARHAGSVYALVYGILGTAPDAEHVLSETFLEAWRSAAEYRPEMGSVHAWLAAIARRRACGRAGEHGAARFSWRAPKPLPQHSA